MNINSRAVPYKHTAFVNAAEPYTNWNKEEKWSFIQHLDSTLYCAIYRRIVT